MARPKCCRRVAGEPPCQIFKPAGVPLTELTEVTLTLDEVEALRLADLDGLYQEQAGERMNISRATFGRIVEQARRKVADALLHGKALRLEGGTVAMSGESNKPANNREGRGSGRGPCGGGQRRGRCCGHRRKREGGGTGSLVAPNPQTKTTVRNSKGE